MRRRDIIEGLRKMGYEVEAHTSIKNGVELRGIRFMNKNSICPVVYTDKIIEESYSLSDAIDIVLDTYLSAGIEEFDKEKLMNPEFILENLYIGLQKESHEEIVKHTTDFEGIEKYLYVRMGDYASFKLTVSLLEATKIDEVYAWRVAERNTFSKTKIVSMYEMLKTTTGHEIEDLPDMPMQFIVGNDMNYRGASAILDKKSLKDFAEKINVSKFFVLPSSTHEVIIIPDDGKCDIETLNEMVAEVNQTQVNPEERLTDRAYVIEV